MSATNTLVRNGHLVESLERSLRSGKHGLSAVPDLLKRVLAEQSWREFTTQRAEGVKHERFADFVITPPLKGLGASIDLIRRVVSDDPEALDLLDRALQQSHGGVRSKPDVITLADPNRHGTSREYALRKLRKDAPGLHADVLAGHLSAHAAMVQAGFRPKTLTVRVEDPASVARVLNRNTTPEFRAELRKLISD